MSQPAKPHKKRQSFGSVYRKRRRDGTLYDGWYVRFVEAGARVERGSFATKTHALDHLASKRSAKSAARASGLPDVRAITVVELVALAEEYFAGIMRPGGMPSRRVMHRNLVAGLGSRMAHDVTGEQVMAVLHELRVSRSYAPATVHNAWRCFSAVFRFGVERRYLRVNPCRGLYGRLPKIDVEERPYLTPEQLRRVYACARPLNRACIILIGEAGLRRTEAVKLTWQEVSSDFATITIAGHRAKGHRARVVPLTALAQETLREIHASRTVPMRGEDRVFHFSNAAMHVGFTAAAADAGLPHITPHGLRHAFASGLVRAGVDVPTVQRLLGHRDIKTTMRYASHAPADAATVAIRALEAHRAIPPDATHSRNSS